jgi:hypothetical protein
MYELLTGILLLLKRKKEAKKEKRVEIWKTLRVSHIPTRQTNNNVFFKMNLL